MIRRSLPIALLAALATAAPVGANDAPLFTRPTLGVPIPQPAPFLPIVADELIDASDDDLRALQLGGGPEFLPAALPPRFTDATTTPSTTGMTSGMSYFGQFVDHDLTLTRVRFDLLLMEPFVFAIGIVDGAFQNRRTPGFDLDSVYRITPLGYPSQPGALGPYDLTNLRFRHVVTEDGALDFPRRGSTAALIGDERNDENGLVAHVHRLFQLLHNRQVDRIAARDGIDLFDVEVGTETWWDVWNEARNYVTAYYQGIVCNQFAAQLTGRTLFEALEDVAEPVGLLSAPNGVEEFAGAAFRLHTLVPVDVTIGPGLVVSPVGPELRGRVQWHHLFGDAAEPAGRLDAAVADPLRHIVDLVVPGNPFPITLDLVQVNLLRGREMELPSGEEYLAFMLAELGADPATSVVRGKQVLDASSGATFLDPKADADVLADLQAGDTDLWAYMMLEAELNGGVLGPVGQDIIERTWLGLLLADDWSLLGAFSDQFTPEQMAFFRTATIERLIEEVLLDGDANQDHFVDVQDLLEILTGWGGDDPRLDLDGDGVIGVMDLLIVLEDWGGR